MNIFEKIKEFFTGKTVPVRVEKIESEFKEETVEKKKTTLSNKVIAQCLLTLLWKNRKDISKYIIKDRVNKNNIDEFLSEFVDYAAEAIDVVDGKIVGLF